MPPKRDIRDFFKPAPAPALPGLPSEPVPTQQRGILPHLSASLASDSTAPRISRMWPSSRTKSHHDSSDRGPAASPTLAVKPTRPPATDAQKTPHAATRPPSTSQSSANSNGSKRVVSNEGEHFVLNSDSETDSDGLLELDLGTLKTSNRFNTTGTAAHPTQSTPYIELQSNGLRRPSGKHKAAKPSLRHLVEAAQKRAETEQQLAEWKADLEKSIEETPPEEFVMTEEALAEALDDDEDGDGDGDKAKRVYLAMQRTNASGLNCVFHFFDEEPESSTLQESPFPRESLPKHGWVTNFEDPSNRDQAFFTGFARQIFKYQQLPEELTAWMIDQVCLGQSDILSTAYIQLLEDHPLHLRTLLDRNRLNDMFKALGANMQCLDLSEEVVPSREPHTSPKRPLPPSLKWLVLLLHKGTSHLPSKSRSHALYILFHLCFDDSVMSDAGTLHIVQDAIESIMCKVPNPELTPILNDIVPLLLKRITHPILQDNLVRSLPSKSPLTAYFQRHLALSFLLYPYQLKVSLSSPKIPSLVHAHLQNSPDFNITRETNYPSLAALISLLDIGIGPGPTTVPYRELFSLQSCQELPAPVSLSSEEVAFNKQIDALAQHIKLVSNKIVEAGAINDLTRLVAKDCSERLYHRLENAVRIGGRKKKNVFGQDDAVQEGSKRVFGQWLGRKIGSRSATPALKGSVNGVVEG